MRWKEISGTLLIVHGRVQPDPAEWDAMIRDCRALARKLQRTLVFADVTLTAEQRRQVADVHKQAGTRAVAVVTSSSLSRMIVTALSWLNSVHRAFEPREVNAALDYLQVPPEQRRVLLETTRQFARELNHDSLRKSLEAA
jgi:hypothetical protein